MRWCTSTSLIKAIRLPFLSAGSAQFLSRTAQCAFLNAQSFDNGAVENSLPQFIVSTKQVMTLPCLTGSGDTRRITS
jgi:hypothetical protein